MGHMTLICAPHSLTHSDTLNSDIVWHSLVMEMDVGDVGPSRLGYYNTKQQICKRNTCHVGLTCTRIFWHAHALCALARGKDAHAYS